MRRKLLKRHNETALERAVRRWLNEEGESYDDGWRGAYDDLAQGGCQSGIVSSLIYYSDTIAFYRRHRAEISEMLTNALRDMGATSPADLFGSTWDKDDPLGHNDHNKNLLAWFAFEATAYNLASRYV